MTTPFQIQVNRTNAQRKARSSHNARKHRLQVVVLVVIGGEVVAAATAITAARGRDRAGQGQGVTDPASGIVSYFLYVCADNLCHGEPARVATGQNWCPNSEKVGSLCRTPSLKSATCGSAPIGTTSTGWS
jgi:hypothetical protein